MVNIKIFGYPFYVLLGEVIPSPLRKPFAKLEQAVKEMGLGQEAVVTIVPSLAFSGDGERKHMPYVEVVDEDPKRRDAVIQALKEADLGLKVEIPQKLDGFIEAEDMKKEAE